jgi:hypothetical protein
VNHPAREKLFALFCGLWLGLTFLKFGNPIILDAMVGKPQSWAEPWPVSWGYWMLAGVGLFAIPVLKFRFPQPQWPVILLAFWLCWQFLSSTRTIEPRLTNPTLAHFATCAVSFLLGALALAPLRKSPWFWTPVLAGFFYVLFAGFEQHAGGLEATRKAFYAQPNWQLYPKEYLLRVESNRIFSTLVYANALAGLLLLLLPAVLWQAWELTARWPHLLRGVFVGLFANLGVACFYWT